MVRVLDGGLLVGAVAVAVQEIVRPYTMRVVGVGDCGGTQCWRAALVLLPQAVVMPFMCLVGAYRAGWSIDRWCTSAHAQGLDGPSSGAVFAFGAAMFGDMLYWQLLPTPAGVPVLRPTMVAHHAACLLGTVHAMVLSPRAAAPCFLIAIVALELGSAICNVHSLYHHLEWAPEPTLARVDKLYLVGMCTSNAVALWALSTWNARAREAQAHLLTRWPAVALTVVMVALRQEAAHRLTLGLGGLLRGE
jgi:hypothetical protein